MYSNSGGLAAAHACIKYINISRFNSSCLVAIMFQTKPQHLLKGSKHLLF